MIPLTAFMLLLQAIGGDAHQMMEASASTRELHEYLSAAHLIVAGRLEAVHVERAPGALGQSGTASLQVQETMWGAADPGARINISWFSSGEPEYSPMEHVHAEGETGIYFLVCPEGPKARETGLPCADGMSAGARYHEALYFPLETRNEVIRILGDYPLRLFHRPAFLVGHAAPIIFHFTNARLTVMKLPGLEYRNGALSHGRGMRLSLTFDSEEGEPIVPLPGKVNPSPDIQDLVLKPGEEFSIALDLSSLFPLDRLGFYFVRLEVEGFPPQPVSAFIMLDPAKGLGRLHNPDPVPAGR